MKRIIKLVIALSAVLLVSGFICSKTLFAADTLPQVENSINYASQIPVNGFYSDGTNKYYYINGKKATGITDIGDNRIYYFNLTTGAIESGWKTVNGLRYYFNPVNYRMALGWTEISGSKYYFYRSTAADIKGHVKGAAATGFQNIDKSTFYFEKTGKMHLGWLNLDGRTYYFNKADITTGPNAHVKGSMQLGWATISGQRYYFYKTTVKTDKDHIKGTALRGWQNVDGARYYFYMTTTDTHNRCQMAKGWLSLSGYKYYLDNTGKMAKGIYKVGNDKYYFYTAKTGSNPLGSMMKNDRIVVSNKLYYFGSDGKCTRMVDGSKKMVALTYDDGPSKYTKTILNTLEKYNSKATFFVIGNRISTYKGTINREFNMGCQVANHTFDHKTLTKCSEDTIKSQISKTDNALIKANGIGSTIMRPPGGANNKTVRATVGKPVILWSVDTRDWSTRNKTKTVNAVLNNVKDGDIVLMHDLYKSTAEASTVIIPKLVERGYQLVTVDELALLRNGGMTNGKIYYSFRKK